jgi:hypothetical protein
MPAAAPAAAELASRYAHNAVLSVPRMDARPNEHQGAKVYLSLGISLDLAKTL